MPKFPSNSQAEFSRLMDETHKLADSLAESRRYPIRHESGAIDKRWRIALEFTGRASPSHVVRFCDEFRVACESESEARGAAAYLEDCRRESFYHDKTPRRQWAALCDIARASWIKNPTPRTYRATPNGWTRSTGVGA